MKSSILALFIACLASALFAGEPTKIGSKGDAATVVPESFYSAQESDDTLFLTPRKNDEDGPISMRLTALRDFEAEKLDAEQVRALLMKFNKTKEVKKAGSNLYTTKTDSDTAPDGTKWRYNHFAIYVDHLIVTGTIQTIEGPEKERQCKELWDAVPDILAKLERKIQ